MGLNDDLIDAYRLRFPEGEDSSDIESNPPCDRCRHSRGAHEMPRRDRPYGYCVDDECDCTGFESA